LIALHIGKGGSVASALGRSIDYVKNPDKTNDGEWVRNSYSISFTTRLEKFAKMIAHSSKRCSTNFVTVPSTYECDPLTADAEFLFAKNQYAMITGRDQGKRNVLAYHLRQSFKPGEIDPATANRIGYELFQGVNSLLGMDICQTPYAFSLIGTNKSSCRTILL
jgi:hypothetical protein